MPLNENRNKKQTNVGRNEEQSQSETGEGSSADTGKGDGNNNGVLGKENLEDVVNEVRKASTMEECEVTDSNLFAIEGEEDMEMIEDGSVFKTPAIKRKLKKKGHGSRKVTGDEMSGKDVENSGIQMESDMSNIDESAPESGSESSGSVNSVSQKRSARSDYTLEKI